jgi:pimeloyl-ACP methyl ester carboxylesterase
MTTTAAPRISEDEQAPGRSPRRTRSRIAWIVAGSLAAGPVAALLLVAAPFTAARENVLTGALLLGLALGWALLALLSVRFSEQPQGWAMAPAAFLTAAAVVSFSGSATAQAVLAFAWPPALAVLVVWMVLRARRQLRSRVARSLLYPAFALLALAAVAGGTETVHEAVDAAAHPMPGRLVDVGDHRLHLHCTGSGGPTVVLQPGGGGASSDLGWIAPAVAHDTRVCVYDRAGHGWSDAVDVSQDGERIAADLHALLHRANVPGPYVLAGHSFGGLYTLRFAARFPNEVAGMVLLDSTAPKPGPARHDPAAYDVVDRVAGLAAAASHLGLARLVAQGSYSDLPPAAREDARATGSTARYLGSSIEEYLKADAAMQQASALTGFGAKPLMVVTADEAISDRSWQAEQDRLAGLSTDSVHRHVAATHESLVYDETDAAAASRAIRDVVAAVRDGRPLADH